jgi:uncharacterized protein
MGNPAVHFDIIGPDPETTGKFYSELFGWHTQTFPEMGGYTMIDAHAGGGINGGFGPTQAGQSPFVTFYVEVGDLQETLDKGGSLGAKTLVPPTEVPNIVTFAHFADPQGNVIGLVKGGGEGPGVSAGDNPKVDWFEVLGPDPKALWSFYRELFGWEIKESAPDADMVYGQVDTGADRGITGGIGGTPDGQPHVTVYARVEDLQKYLDRADELGGTTIMPPMKVDDHTTIAVIRDPQGTMFGLYTGM